MKGPLTIRGHHLLCIQGFRGLGYSSEFISNFAQIAKTIHSNQNISLKLVCHADDICTCCPHLREGKCSKSDDAGKHVRSMDRAVLGLLQVSSDRIISAGEAYTQLAKVVQRDGAEAVVERICTGCEWMRFGFCVDGLKQLVLARNQA